MAHRNSESRPELEWVVMDGRKMDLPNNSFDLILDKSTMDALLCGKNSFLNVARMLRQCQRIMKEGSVYIAVSYGEPKHRLLHFYRSHLKFEVNHVRLERVNQQGGKSVHWVYVCRKMKGADEMEKLWREEVKQIRQEEAQRGGILNDDDSLASDSEQVLNLNKDDPN